MTALTNGRSHGIHALAAVEPDDPGVIGAAQPTGIDPPPTDLCVCGHPTEQHDPIASRYCEATIAGDLKRGCVCRTAR